MELRTKPAAVAYDTYLVGMALLTSNYPPRGASEASGDALLAAWWRVLHGDDQMDTRGVLATVGGKPWITSAVFDRAVRECLATVKEWLPSVAEFVAICEYSKEAMENEARRNQPALPPPQRREVDAIDESDPYSCTAEERERWAKEDQWIRGWAGTLPARTSPEILERLSAVDREWVLRSERNNAGVAAWPSLTPAARRAKERRIEGERQAAVASIQARLGRVPIFGIPTRPTPALEERVK